MSKVLKIVFLLFSLVMVLQTIAQDTIPLNTAHSFEVSFQEEYSYSWWFVDESEIKTFFDSNSNVTEEYYWDNEGTFDLFVQATDGNGCLTEVISKIFIVKEEEVTLPILVALPDFSVGYENTIVAGNLRTNDFIVPDISLNLIYSLVDEPLPGLILNPDGSFIYQPPQNMDGKVSFAYKVCFEQEEYGCATSEALIHLISSTSEGNIAPVAATDVVLTFPNQTVISNLLINDIDPDESNGSLAITTTPIVEPLHGTVEIAEDGSFSYTPDLDFEGTDKFYYGICDKGIPSLCDSAWVYIVVDNFGTGSSKPISTSDDVFITSEECIFNLTGNDFDLLGQDLIYNTVPIVTIQHGTLEIFENGTFSYIPDSGYIGIDWFIYEVCNTNTEPVCSKGTGFIIVNLDGDQYVGLAGNDTTIGSCDSYTLGGLQSNTIGFNYQWEPSGNLNDPTSPSPVFTPGNTTEFRLTVTNDFGFYSVDTVIVTVSSVFAEAGDDLLIYKNSSVVLDGSASYGEDLQYQWTTFNGSIESGAGSAEPLINKAGKYYLQVTDKFGCVAFDSVNIDLLTNAPIAIDDYDTTSYHTEIQIPVLVNDTDPDNDIDSLSLSIVASPFSGRAFIDFDNFTIHYQPNKNFSGNDYFEYQICDSTNNCDQATVNVLVTDFVFLIPDAFSPNGDNINDYFEILGIEWYDGNFIEIYNRWGNKVYMANNYGINTTPKFWDGKSNTGVRLGNEELPSGTYFYILNLGNGEKRIAGSVYLDR